MNILDVSPFNMGQEFSHHLLRIRRFMEEKGYDEILTSILVEAGAVEQSIDCFSVEGKELHTSPELAMKTYLATYPDKSLYQITPCFRKDPITEIHKKEFLMLEYYRINSSTQEMILELQNLIEVLFEEALPFIVFDIHEYFQKNLSHDFPFSLGIKEWKSQCMKVFGENFSESETWPDVFFKIYVSQIETRFTHKATVVINFPSLVSPMSCYDERSLVSDRFELYLDGIEVANGCREIRDYDKQLKLLAKQNELRVADGKKPHSTPHAYLKALSKGLPECSGVAIGIERLFMALKKLKGSL